LASLLCKKMIRRPFNPRGRVQHTLCRGGLCLLAAAYLDCLLEEPLVNPGSEGHNQYKTIEELDYLLADIHFCLRSNSDLLTATGCSPHPVGALIQLYHALTPFA